jgi:methyl-accepting chemotaxis protein
MGGFSAAMVALNAQMGDMAINLYDKTFVGMHYADKVQTAFVRLEGRHTDADLPLTQDDDTAAIASMLNDLDVAADRAATPKQKTGVATAKADLQALISTAPTPDRPTLAQVDKHLKRLTTRFADDAVDRRDAADGLITEVRTTIFGLAAVALVGALLFAASLILSVVRPLRQMIKAIQATGDGELKVPTRLVKRSDEIGQMVQALVDQREAARLLEAARVRTEQAQAQAIIDRERNEAQQAQLAVAQAQANIVSSLSDGLGRLAAGDLTVQIDEPFPAEFETLRADFNQTLAHLHDTLTAVASSAASVNAGSSEISAAGDDLSRRTENQAAALEETAAAVEELTTTVRRSAEGAIRATDVVQTAQAAAQRSGAIVRDAVKAMKAIETASNEIAQILGLIDEITFQTNLLALNAGVEAARAGDAGRGFAVVAQEVRALALRSATAAKEIKSLIQDSARHVDSGVKLVNSTGLALNEISAQVSEITGLVREIATAAQEQAATLGEVNTSISQMDQATQQNAAMVEQTTAASHSLAREAVELLSLVREFDLGDADEDAAREAA